jgi:pyrroline-5-carboxylate reductase
MLDDIVSTVGIHSTPDNQEVFRSCDVIILAVKPQFVSTVLQEVTSLVHADHLIISIAAGIQIAQLEKLLPPMARVIRVMPNASAFVQCSASVFSPGSAARFDDCQLVKKLFSSIGCCEQLPESQIDAVTGVSGSGPAYGFMIIEAMADGGVKMGLSRETALRLAAQTMMGAGKMVLESGKHPGELKDMVCSPGGTTIAAVHHLESAGIRAAMIGAVEAAAKRAADLSSLGKGDAK